MEIISLISSIASLIIAILAIWLSIAFFKMSAKASSATTEAAKDIESSVKRLENLFDKLYSDTFSMMKETVTDMRNHIWNNPATDDRDISQELKKEIHEQINKALDASKKSADKNPQEIAEKLQKSLETVLRQSITKQNAVDKEKILEMLKIHAPISVKKLSEVLGVNINNLVIPNIFELRKEGKIYWQGNPNSINGESILTLEEHS